MSNPGKKGWDEANHVNDDYVIIIDFGKGDVGDVNGGHDEQEKWKLALGFCKPATSRGIPRL